MDVIDKLDARRQRRMQITADGTCARLIRRDARDREV
jgi:hypothetical protein